MRTKYKSFMVFSGILGFILIGFWAKPAFSSYCEDAERCERALGVGSRLCPIPCAEPMNTTQTAHQPGLQGNPPAPPPPPQAASSSAQFSVSPTRIQSSAESICDGYRNNEQLCPGCAENSSNQCVAEVGSFNHDGVAEAGSCKHDFYAEISEQLRNLGCVSRYAGIVFDHYDCSSLSVYNEAVDYVRLGMALSASNPLSEIHQKCVQQDNNAPQAPQNPNQGDLTDRVSIPASAQNPSGLSNPHLDSIRENGVPPTLPTSIFLPQNNSGTPASAPTPAVTPTSETPSATGCSFNPNALGGSLGSAFTLAIGLLPLMVRRRAR